MFVIEWFPKAASSHIEGFPKAAEVHNFPRIFSYYVHCTVVSSNPFMCLLAASETF
jgi:hypothetical protein